MKTCSVFGDMSTVDLSSPCFIICGITLRKGINKKKQNVQYGFHLQWQYRFLVFYF